MGGRTGVIGGALLLLVVLAGCWAGPGLGVMKGSGVMARESRTVSGFDEVELSGVGQVTILEGADSGVVIDAEDNLIPLITTTVANNRLTIGWEPGFRSVNPTMPVKFAVTLPALSLLRLSGSGEIQASRPPSRDLQLNLDGSGAIAVDGLQLDRLSVRINGSGTVESAGEATSQNLSINGSGNYQAADLVSRQATVSIPGSGRATVRAAESLDVQINGSGNVRYYGDPSVTQKIRGSGRITRAGQ